MFCSGLFRGITRQNLTDVNLGRTRGPESGFCKKELFHSCPLETICIAGRLPAPSPPCLRLPHRALSHKRLIRPRPRRPRHLPQHRPERTPPTRMLQARPYRPRRLRPIQALPAQALPAQALPAPALPAPALPAPALPAPALPAPALLVQLRQLRCRPARPAALPRRCLQTHRLCRPIIKS